MSMDDLATYNDNIPSQWTRARMIALKRRQARELYRAISGTNLAGVLDNTRRQVENTRLSDTGRRRALALYRSALNEAVVSRHWTVEWSALTNTHTIR